MPPNYVHLDFFVFQEGFQFLLGGQMEFVLTHKNALIQASECETHHCFMFLKIVQASAQFQAHDCQVIGISQTSGQFFCLAKKA